MRRFLLAAVLSMQAPLVSHAHDYKLGRIVIGHPWARPTAEGSQTGAAYLTLKNTGAEPDRLVEVSSPVAGQTQVHVTSDDNGVMKMREVRGGVELAPGVSTDFKPGSYHVMLLGLKQKLDEGQHIPLKLTFAKAGSIDVEVYVEKTPGGMQTGGMTYDHDMKSMPDGMH